jgi:hypothetical protein
MRAGMMEVRHVGRQRYEEHEVTCYLSLQSRQLASAMPAFPLPSRLKQGGRQAAGF